MHADHNKYLKFTGKARIEKSVNSLLGLIEGISADFEINATERGFLDAWLSEHSELWDKHPYSELMPIVAAAISDGHLSNEERDDILWLCEKLRSTQYFDAVTADIQRLHGVVSGIASDGIVKLEELRGLSEWLSNHEHLRTCWPYDEVSSLVTQVLADKQIDEKEQTVLQRFFSEFVGIADNQTIVNPRISEEGNIGGLCAVCPEILILGASFCFTGASSKFSRTEFSNLIVKLGGLSQPGVTKSLNYLVIGADGNPCWAYACYGRKVEKAVQLRKSGAKLMLIHENDFHDAVADLR